MRVPKCCASRVAAAAASMLMLAAAPAFAQPAPPVALPPAATPPAAAPAPPAAAPAGPAAPAPRSAFNLEKLLADPVPENPKINFLRQRRTELAKQEADPVAYAAMASEFEKAGAFYPALELLFLTQQMTEDPAVRSTINARMAQLQAKGQPGRDQVDAAVQLWASSGPAKAIEMLDKIIAEQPYNELAHYQRGYRIWMTYLAHDSEAAQAIPAQTRAQMFRDIYTELLVTLEIDPLYNDAYYQLSQSRDLLSEDRSFIENTEGLSKNSLTFMNDATPAIAKIEKGDRSAKPLVDAGDALYDMGRYPYAVLFWRTAMRKQGNTPEQLAALKVRIDTALADKLK